MATINIFFHMLIDEVIDFVKEVCQRHNLSVELEQWNPELSRRATSGDELAQLLKEFDHIDRIWLLCKPPGYRKYERFMLNMPRLRNYQMSQGQLGASCDKTKALAVLKQIAEELKRRTPEGAWVLTPAGTACFDKRLRMSEGAANQSREGKTQLVNIAFTQLIRPDRPNRHRRRERGGNAPANARQGPDVSKIAMPNRRAGKK